MDLEVHNSPLFLAVSTCQLFKSVDWHTLSDLADNSKRIHLKKGQMVFRAGEVSHGLYMVKKGQVKKRDKLITSTDKLGKLASIPIVVNIVNASNRNEHTRALLEDTLGIHSKAKLPEYHSKTLSKRTRDHEPDTSNIQATETTSGKVAIFGTCYGEYNEPHLGEDLLKVFEHNGIATMVIPFICW